MGESPTDVIIFAMLCFCSGVASSSIEDYKCIRFGNETRGNHVTLTTSVKGCHHTVRQMEVCATQQCRTLCVYVLSNNSCENKRSYGPECDCVGSNMTMHHRINSSYETFSWELVAHDRQLLKLRNISIHLRENDIGGTTGFTDEEKTTERLPSSAGMIDTTHAEFYSEGQLEDEQGRVFNLLSATPDPDPLSKRQDSNTFVTQDKVVFISSGMSALTVLAVVGVGILITRCWRRKQSKVKASKTETAPLPPTPHQVRNVRNTDTLVEMLARQLQLPVRDLMLRRGPGRDRHSRTQSIPSTIVTGGYEQINEELLEQLQQSAADLYSRYSTSAYTDYAEAASLLTSPTPSAATSQGQPAPNPFAFPPPCGSVAFPGSPRAPWVAYPWSWLSARAAGYPGYSARHDYHNVPATKPCTRAAVASCYVQSSDAQSPPASLDSDSGSDVCENTAAVNQSYENIHY